MRAPPLHDRNKRPKLKPAEGFSVKSVLDRLEHSELGDILIGVGAGINAMAEARKSRRRGETIDVKPETEDK